MHLSSEGLVFSPSDLHAWLACRHLVALERAHALASGAARGAAQTHQPHAAVEPEARSSVLARRGDEHERRYLERLKAGGRRVVEIPRVRSDARSLAAAEAQTLSAMRAGADVVYQATFFDGRWRGQADFLERRDDVASALGPYSYDVVDTKLARRARVSAVVQLVCYAHQVERLQGTLPAELRVALGDGGLETLDPRDFGSVVRRLRRDLEAAAMADALQSGSGRARLDVLGTTYPEPVRHCGLCSHEADCDGRRRADDHLSLVAGMRRDHADKLAAGGVATVRALGDLRLGDIGDQPRRRAFGIGEPTLARLQAQAKLQIGQRETGRVGYELVAPRPDEGLALLPAPDDGDVFFDMEGDPYVEDGGLEYLFGLLVLDDRHDGRPLAFVDEANEAERRARYLAFWAHDRAAEKRALEAVVDAITQRWARHPGMHVYHYAPYERTALQRLAMRHATREDEVDRILRGKLLVDLYQVVRHGVRVSQESYSIKKLEPLYMGARKADVKDAGSSIDEYERWLELGAAGDARPRRQAVLDGIERYNEEDCISTWKLRDWLEARRDDAKAHGPIPRPAPPTEKDDTPLAKARREADADAAQLAERLLAGLPADRAAFTEDDETLCLLAHLVSFHKREAKPEWWAYFERAGMSEEELFDDSEALAGLRYEGVAGKEKQSALHVFRFDPTQAHKVLGGKNYVDPRTVHEPSPKTWDVHEVDRRDGKLVIKAGSRKGTPACTALIPGCPISTAVLAAALRDVARAVLERPRGDDFPALRALLRREPPRLTRRAPQAAQRALGSDAGAAQTVDELRELAVAIDRGVLPVQGPPGAGKTFVGARMVVSLVKAGKRVALTANSHKVITNLLREIMQVAHAEKVRVRAMQLSPGSDDAPGKVTAAKDNDEVESAIEAREVDLLAGTAFLLARPKLRGAFDTLVVDEAGQMSLANVLAAGTSAKSLVLLGDPQQLGQPSKGTHPERVAVSALAHLLGPDKTVRPGRGVFLPTTRRMHPDVCRFISAAYYEGRLAAHEGCASQRIGGPGSLAGTGLRFVPVDHHGRGTHAPEEVEAVARLVGALVGRPFTDARGHTKTLTQADVLIVAPFNVQVAELAERLGPTARVGTVDKFQGQEAPVVIVSMASSTTDDAPRGMEFVFDPHRLNVTVSRAKALAFLIASPGLLRTNCANVEQLRMANGMCAFVEGAVEVALEDLGVARATPSR